MLKAARKVRGLKVENKGRGYKTALVDPILAGFPSFLYRFLALAYHLLQVEYIWIVTVSSYFSLTTMLQRS